MLRAILALVAAAFCATPGAQPHLVATCDSPEARQFDFWLGEWTASYELEGKKATSRNRISKILNGCAILEEFTGAPGIVLEGRSLSTFDRNTRRWGQTWVDSEGSYLDFHGALVDGRMIFTREAERDGRKFTQRMVWQDIAADSFKWLWQRSEDEGKTWKTLWEIDYRRVK